VFADSECIEIIAPGEAPSSNRAETSYELEKENEETGKERKAIEKKP
jgi:hypothetical protein